MNAKEVQDKVERDRSASGRNLKPRRRLDASSRTIAALIREAQMPDAPTALSGLDGLPIGSWGQTEQAYRQFTECLPIRSERAYSASDAVTALYDTAGDFYRFRQ